MADRAYHPTSMDGTVDRYRRAVGGFSAVVAQVQPDQWHLPTPCAEWDVRQLLNHVTGEDAWVPPLLAGRTIEEVGDSLDGDLLGDDAAAAWAARSAAAVAAAEEDGAADRTVHNSSGRKAAAQYLDEMTADHVIHTWDLARGIGAPEELDPELVEWALAFFVPVVEEWRAFGVFAAPVDVPDDASAQHRLLALTGRQI